MQNLNNFMYTLSVGLTILLFLSMGNLCQADLVAFWHFEEPAGNFVADSVNDHDGVATTDVVPSTDYPALVPANTRSRSFPGGLSGGGVIVPDHSDLDLIGDFTLEAWIKSSWSAPGSDFLLAKHAHKGDSDGSWMLEVNGSAPVHFKIYPTGSDISVFSLANVIPDNQWAHLALAYDVSQDHYDYYVNAQPAGSGTAGIAGQIKDTSRPLWIGGMEANPETFSGLIDEVQIWNEYRTQIQIAEDMVAVVPGPGAFVLAAVGLGFSGWLCKRKASL